MQKSRKVVSADPEKLFDVLFASLIACVVCVRWTNQAMTPKEQVSLQVGDAKTNSISDGAISLRRRFLAVFWLFKFADWMQGPYFFDVYVSKVICGRPLDESIVSKLFLSGFATSAVLGPALGRLVDALGRKAGSIAFALFYTLSALSTKSSSLTILFLGRVCGGIGTSLLNAAPESWMVTEHLRNGYPSSGIGENFSLAYFGDAVAAILAGQVAGFAAKRRGPVGPFMLSTVFLGAGGAVVAGTWLENTAPKSAIVCNHRTNSTTIGEALRRMCEDYRILSVAAVQAFFEGAMYIFVMQWPPALINVIKDGKVPFGKVFSCFMASCMLGSSAFAGLVRKQPVEKIIACMLGLSTCAMGTATLRLNSPISVISSFFAFEACVGVYFPSIGTLRSKYIPESHSVIIRTLIGIPLNILVVSVMLSSKRLGIRGSLGCSTIALAFALLAQFGLLHKTSGSGEKRIM